MTEHTRRQSPRALVTGASSGIGEAFAERLARDGYDLILVARRRDRLEDLADRLHKDSAVAVDILVADLGKSADRHAVEARLADDDGLEILVNNAGFAIYAPVANTDPDDLEDIIQVNVVALTLLTRAALPGMLSRNRGTIINVSSRLSFMPSATRAAYSAAKAYVNNFTLALHEEVQGTGVQVQVLCPGLTRTEFHQRSGTNVAQLPDAAFMTAEAVVIASLAGLRLGEVICIPGLDDQADLARFEEARRAFTQAPYHGRPAPRYTT